MTKHEKQVQRLHEQIAQERQLFHDQEAKYLEDDRKLHAELHGLKDDLEESKAMLKDTRAQITVCEKCDRYKSGTTDCYGCQADALTFFAAQLRSGILLALTVYERPTDWTLARVSAVVEALPSDSKVMLADAMETGKSMGGILSALRGLPVPQIDADAKRSADWIRQVIVGGVAGLGMLAYWMGQHRHASKKPARAPA